MKATIQLEGALSTVNTVVELAMEAGVLRSFNVEQQHSSSLKSRKVPPIPNFAVGDRVRVYRSNSKEGVKKGANGTVESVRSSGRGKKIRVQWDEGEYGMPHVSECPASCLLRTRKQSG